MIQKILEPFAYSGTWFANFPIVFQSAIHVFGATLGPIIQIDLKSIKKTRFFEKNMFSWLVLLIFWQNSSKINFKQSNNNEKINVWGKTRLLDWFSRKFGIFIENYLKIKETHIFSPKKNSFWKKQCRPNPWKNQFSKSTKKQLKNNYKINFSRGKIDVLVVFLKNMYFSDFFWKTTKKIIFPREKMIL